jgi:hypothetical protein
MPPLPAAPSLELDQALAQLLALLETFLPATAPPLPTASVSLIAMTERGVGLGGMRGLERVGPFELVELRGVRVDGLVRFHVFGTDPPAAALAARSLQTALAGARDSLWTSGLLRMSLSDATEPAAQPGGAAFSVMLEYRVLYEYRIADTGGADSLIARIPINADPEEPESLARETTTVTDELARWDQLEAPLLRARGSRSVARLAALSFFPGATASGTVTLTRTFDGASAAPVTHPSLVTFLDAVADPAAPERNGRVEFASVADLLAALGPVGATLELGDWDLDGVLDAYEAHELVLDPPIVLPHPADRLELAYEHPALDEIGVVYLRFAGISA